MGYGWRVWVGYARERDGTSGDDGIGETLHNW